MSIKVYFKSILSKKFIENLVLFTDEKFDVSNLRKHISNTEFFYICELLKKNNLNKSLNIFEINSKKRVILIQIKPRLKITEIENLGSKFYTEIAKRDDTNYFINSDTVISEQKNFISHFVSGAKLKSYKFLNELHK